jgi:general secretion pathway protein L
MDQHFKQLKRHYSQWVADIWLLLPPAWLKWFVLDSDQRLMLSVDPLGLRISQPEAGRRLRLLQASLESESVIRRSFVEQFPSVHEFPVDLVLNPDEVINARMALPRAAESNLYTIVGFEIDRLTPFRPDLVYYDCWVDEGQSTKDLIAVEVRATPREVVDNALNLLGPLGWTIDRIYAESTRGHKTPCNLLPATYRDAAPSSERWISLTLKLSAIGFCLALLVLPKFLMDLRLEELKGELPALLSKTKEVESLRRETEQLLHDMRFLSDKKIQSPVLVESMNELTQITPDDTWLDSVQITGQHVVIQGLSGSTSLFIEQLEKSPFFENTKFLSPVTKDLSNGLERFQIGSDLASNRGIQKGKASAKPAYSR